MTNTERAPIMVTSDDGTSIALHDLGGRGRATLFAHAASLHGRVWDPVAAALSDRMHSWAPDLRGHGESGPSGSPVDWKAFGSDIAAVARSLDAPLLGIGHSLGGAAMLSAEIAQPGTFAELILYEPAVARLDPVTSTIQAMFAAVARRRRREFESLRSAYETFAKKPPTNVLAPSVLDAYVTHGFAADVETGLVRIKCDPDLEAAIYESEGASELWSRLTALHCPVTVVYGDRSELWNEISAVRFAEAIGASVATMSRAGHFGPLEDPTRFAELVVSTREQSSARLVNG